MAQWVVHQNRRSNLTLSYKTPADGASFTCGELRRDTPASMILQWVIDQAATKPGDLIKLHDGTILQVLPQPEVKA